MQLVGAMTFSTAAFSIMTLIIKGLFVTLGTNDTQHNNTKPLY